MKKIYITQRRVLDKYGVPCDFLESHYIRLFSSYEVTMLPVPNIGRDVVKKYFSEDDTVSGLVLSGGNNICPGCYGSNAPGDDGCSDIRDETELELLGYAREHQIPVLGICRGMQLINVFFGGSINREIGEMRAEKHHSGEIHELSVTEATAAGFLGSSGWKMKSYHRQGILSSDLAPPLRQFIVSGAGVLEGIYHPSLPIAGIQFHPEREVIVNRPLSLLVEAFINRRLYWS